jgi:hypothetical protein
MSTQPLFDMSQAQPINSAVQGKPLFDMSKATPLPGSGEQLNDVGNRVIVPRPGEEFADTMKRAVASGKTVTQPQIDAEMKTAPAKVAQTLTAAPVIGAAGAAALTGADLGAYQAMRGAGYAVEALKDILPSKATADQIFKVGKIVRDLGLTAASGRYIYHAFYPDE